VKAVYAPVLAVFDNSALADKMLHSYWRFCGYQGLNGP
jgi:hypothetical protein